MRPLTVLLTLCLGSVLALGTSSCGSSGTRTGRVVVVQVKDMTYIPKTVTIHPGDTVEWRFADGGLPHDVVGDGAQESSLHSKLLAKGIYRHTFAKAGTVSYHCSIHPMMVGSVAVED